MLLPSTARFKLVCDCPSNSLSTADPSHTQNNNSASSIASSPLVCLSFLHLQIYCQLHFCQNSTLATPPMKQQSAADSPSTSSPEQLSQPPKNSGSNCSFGLFQTCSRPLCQLIGCLPSVDPCNKLAQQPSNRLPFHVHEEGSLNLHQTPTSSCLPFVSNCPHTSSTSGS